MPADEALEVMLLNPAVLQCGPTLEFLGASEIKAFARLRAAGNTLVPADARGAVLSALLACVLFTIGASRSGDPELLQPWP